MVKPTNWVGLEQWADAIVDGRFGEPVWLIPWVNGTQVYTPGEQGPDPSRQMRQTQGALVTPGARLVGESGRATGGGFNTQELEAETWLSMTLDNMGGSIALWRQYDRVYFPDRDQMFSISYLEPSATRRPNIHLIYDHGIQTGDVIPTGLIVPTIANSLYFNTTNLAFYRAADTTVNNWSKL